MAIDNDTACWACSKCKHFYALNSRNFHKNKNSRTGFVSICKLCACRIVRDWGEKNADYVRDRAKQYYADHADHIKVRVREYSINHADDLRISRKRYYEENKDVITSKNKEWVDAHPDEVKAIKKAYIERDPERRRKQAREYHHRHPELSREQARRSRRNNPATARRSYTEYRKRKMNAEGTYTNEDVRNIFEDQNERCFFCGITLFWNIPADYHIDHLKPLNRGGSNWPDNIVIACPSCNSSRQDRTVEEWQKVRGW